MLARQGACEQTGDLPVAVLEGVDDEKVEDKQAGQEHRGFPADRVSTAARPGRVAGGRGAPASSGEAAVELLDMVASQRAGALVPGAGKRHVQIT